MLLNVLRLLSTKIINNPRGTGASTSTTTATPAASISAAQAGSSSASQSKTTKPPLSQNALLQIRGYEFNIGFKQDVIQQLQDAMKSLDRKLIILDLQWL